ncbi:MAG: MASE3 domain-containing protein [Candidatus Bipolaricaulia bacterium]
MRDLKQWRRITVNSENEILHIDRRLLRVVLVALALALGGYFLAIYNYLLFHSLIEVWSIVVAIGIFIIAWHSRDYIENDYLLFLGIAYLFIGGVDLIHTLSYEGMGVFPARGSNLPTQLWIIARYMEGLSLLAAPLFITRKLNEKKIISFYLLATVFLFLTVFHWKIFPDSFVTGAGLTPFKVVSEYVISGLLVGAILGLFYYRRKFDRTVFWLLVSSIGLTVLAELAFTFYVSVYGLSNLVGHLFKLASFYLIYEALIETGLREPQRLIFREQQKYKELVDNIDSGVAVYEAVDDGKEFVIKEFNSAAERIDELDREEVIGRKVSEVFTSMKEFDLFEVLQQVWETGEQQYHPVSTYEDQRIMNWRENYVFKLPSGEVVAVYDDVTSQKRTEKELEEQREKLKNLHDAVDELQHQNTEEDILQTAVEVAEDMLDFKLCAIATREGEYLIPRANSANLDPEETARFKVGEGIAGKTVERGETIWGEDLRNRPEAQPTSENFRAFISVPIGEMGNLQVVSKKAGRFTERDVELVEILADHLREELRRVRLEEDLRQQAIRDPLTDLYNRRYFNETLKKEVQQAKRYERTLAFLMIDINRFKEINDRYTHQTGDEVLQEVADLLSDNVRSADTVVRYGGDEFLVMMPETEDEVTDVVDRINRALAQWNDRTDLIDFSLTLAMGVSYWNYDQNRDVEEALKEADEKMYEDKRG